MTRLPAALAVLIVVSFASEVHAGKLAIFVTYKESAKKGGYVDVKGYVTNVGMLTISKIRVEFWRANQRPEGLKEMTFTKKNEFGADVNGQWVVATIPVDWVAVDDYQAIIEVTFTNLSRIRSTTVHNIRSSGN